MERLLFILPGWKERSISFSKLSSLLKAKNIKVKIINFPFFYGKEGHISPLRLQDFAEFVLREIKKGERKVSIFGHSFGGRVAIKIASHHPEKVDKLILCDAAGIKRRSLKKITFWFLAKIGGAIFSLPLFRRRSSEARDFLYKLARERDYLKTKGALKETFRNIIGEDLTPLLPKIKAKTLIIWGKNDKTTPLKDGQLMERLISNSRLVILENTGHNPHRENSERLAEEILKFLKEK